MVEQRFKLRQWDARGHAVSHYSEIPVASQSEEESLSQSELCMIVNSTHLRAVERPVAESLII